MINCEYSRFNVWFVYLLPWQSPSWNRKSSSWTGFMVSWFWFQFCETNDTVSKSGFGFVVIKHALSNHRFGDFHAWVVVVWNHWLCKVIRRLNLGHTSRWLKLVCTSNVYFTAFKSSFLSLSIYLLPRMNVMLDFIWPLPVHLRGTRNKWTVPKILVHGRIRTTNTASLDFQRVLLTTRLLGKLTICD